MCSWWGFWEMKGGRSNNTNTTLNENESLILYTPLFITLHVELLHLFIMLFYYFICYEKSYINTLLAMSLKCYVLYYSAKKSI